MFVCFIHILLFLSFNARWVRWGVASHQPDHPDWRISGWPCPHPCPCAHIHHSNVTSAQQLSPRPYEMGLFWATPKVVTSNFICSLVSLRMLSLMTSLANAMWPAILSEMQVISNCRVFLNGRCSWLSVALCFTLQAGLLGCEAVLSSMALMQASSMAAPPKKMMAPLGHGPPQREGPDRGPQSHMILPSGMSCPPLVRTDLGFGAVICYAFNIMKGVNPLPFWNWKIQHGWTLALNSVMMVYSYLKQPPASCF